MEDLKGTSKYSYKYATKLLDFVELSEYIDRNMYPSDLEAPSRNSNKSTERHEDHTITLPYYTIRRGRPLMAVRSAGKPDHSLSMAPAAGSSSSE